MCLEKCSFKTTESNLAKHMKSKHLGVILLTSQLRQVAEIAVSAECVNSQTVEPVVSLTACLLVRFE